MFFSHSRNSHTAALLIVTLIALVLITGAAAPQPASDAAAASQNPWDADYPITYETDDVRIYAETYDQVELAERSLAIYADAGLELPHVEMWMASDTSKCIHPSGAKVRGFTTWRDGQVVLFHCGDTFTMLHELAHAYDRYALTDEAREAFLEHRGLEKWQVVGQWGRSGEEHYANVLAWGLDESARRDIATEPSDDASLATAYALVASWRPKLADASVTGVAADIDAADGSSLDAGASPSGDAAPDEASATELSVDEQQAIVLTQSLYIEAGLETPRVSIAFHADQRPCGGFAGFHRLGTDGVSMIDICPDHTNPETVGVERMRVLRHEMAHAYVAQTLAVDAQEELLGLLGLSSWNAGPWHERGIEFAAEIVVWGLRGGRYRFHSQIETPTCATLHTALAAIADIGTPECDPFGPT